MDYEIVTKNSKGEITVYRINGVTRVTNQCGYVVFEGYKGIVLAMVKTKDIQFLINLENGMKLNQETK